MSRRRGHRPLALVSSLLVAAGAIAACTGTESVPAPSATSVGTVPQAGTDGALTFPVYDDPEAPIYAAVGSRFGVVVPSEPSAGFRWELARAPDASVVLPLGDQILTDSTVVPLEEGQAATVLSFVAAAEGETSIELVYVGPDGTPHPDGRAVTFTVVVNADGRPPPVAPATTIEGT